MNLNYPLVSIVVIAYNEQRKVGSCLDSLLALDYPKDKIEIILVDNGSTDETAEVVMGYPIRYIYEPQKSRARARNKGIEVAGGEFVAFLDAHCVAHKDWLKNLLMGCNDRLIGACGGEIYTYDASTFWEKYMENRGFFHKEHFIGEKCLFPILRTGNVLYPKSVLENIGLFDEIFCACEDICLSLRIVLRGLKLVYVSNAIVYHKHRSSLSNLCRQFFEYGRYVRILQEKYKDIIKLDWGPGSKKVFHSKIKYFKKFVHMKKLLEILFLLTDLIIYLAYSIGWLSFSLFRHFSINPVKQPDSIPDKAFIEVDKELVIRDISKCNNPY